MNGIPGWLHALSIASLCVGFASALWIAWDEAHHPQQMRIMNFVWPVTGLYAPFVGVWGYCKWGRLATAARKQAAAARGEDPPSMRETPFPAKVAKGSSHCGAGCTLGDICAEWLVYLVPAIAVALGWRTIFPDKIFAVWIVDYVFAFGFGIVFQYFTIKPMRNLSPGEGIVQAVKADTLSLTSWQLGMYGFMAFAHFYVFATLIGVRLEVASPEFWLMMQIAMWCGFATSYPVNWWLIQSGIKEAM